MTIAKPGELLPCTHGKSEILMTCDKCHKLIAYTAIPQSPPVQSDADDAEINAVIRMVKRCLMISNQSPMEFSRRSIETLIRAAEQRVASQTGVPQEVVDALEECHDQLYLLAKNPDDNYFVKKSKQALAALTAQSNGVNKEIIKGEVGKEIP